jgi:hypothetical protein
MYKRDRNVFIADVSEDIAEDVSKTQWQDLIRSIRYYGAVA